MYDDHRPCRTCGAPVDVGPRRPGADDSDDAPDGPVGPAGGVVGGGDPTLDVRTCTNADCPTRHGDGSP
ncbi:hypothetical protein [Nocardioides litoris]|uniref:hypothetical protein n=1 Tax=Nocardioides litoris TaxID=1926648 RepID=UPI001121E289|nr:hypothetical protein [Nocardioides litoris]